MRGRQISTPQFLRTNLNLYLDKISKEVLLCDYTLYLQSVSQLLQSVGVHIADYTPLSIKLLVCDLKSSHILSLNECHTGCTYIILVCNKPFQVTDMQRYTGMCMFNIIISTTAWTIFNYLVTTLHTCILCVSFQ